MGPEDPFDGLQLIVSRGRAGMHPGKFLKTGTLVLMLLT